MKNIFFILLLLPLITFAQERGSLTIGKITVSYDRMEQSDDTTYYFIDDTLIASEHGNASFLYKNDQATFEAHDTNGDGELDAFLRLDSDAMVTEITGEGASVFERNEPKEFESKSFSSNQDNDDLVGDLSSIKIPKYYNWKLYGLIVLLIGGGTWWYRKKKI